MKDLIEMLDRAHKLDDSTRKPLSESANADVRKKVRDAAKSVKCRLTPEFLSYALEDPDNIIEDELLYYGKALCAEFPKMKYWKFGEDEKLCDMYGNYCIVETGTDEGRILVQLDGHGRIYHLEESLHEAVTSETVYEDWDDVFCAIEDIIESCTIFGKHPYWFDAYQRPDRLILDIGVDDDDTGRTGSHYEATLSNLAQVPTATDELIKYIENLPWKANGEIDVDDEYDDDIDVDESLTAKLESKKITNKRYVRPSKKNVVHECNVMDEKNNLKEGFDEVGTYTYRYIPEDSIEYMFHNIEIDDDEFDAARESGNFTPEMWLTSEAYITEEDGWYQVSLGGMDDYTEFETVEECKEYVEDRYEYFEWAD